MFAKRNVVVSRSPAPGQAFRGSNGASPIATLHSGHQFYLHVNRHCIDSGDISIGPLVLQIACTAHPVLLCMGARINHLFVGHFRNNGAIAGTVAGGKSNLSIMPFWIDCLFLLGK